MPRFAPTCSFLARTPTALALLVLLAASASAQLDLPERSGAPRAPRRGGNQPGLDLPDARPAADAAPTTSVAAPVKGVEPAAPPVAASPAELALQALRTSRPVGAATLQAAVLALRDMGDAGRVAARAALWSEFGSEVVACARVLLAGGLAADRERVLERLRGALPPQSAPALVAALVELDPVGASPEFFAEMLDHPQSSMRAAAAGALAGRATAELVPALARRMESKRTDTRLLVVDLAAGIDDDAARELVFTALGDESARVAYRAAVRLARSAAPGVEARLLAEVTEGPYLLRASSYALLAIVEREDARSVAILGEEHVPLLLANLTAENVLATGAAACALAGIGFRRPSADQSGWLDLLVPHHLVRAVAATEFHRDFTSLQAPAERRLALIAGFTLGSDGRAWQRWWGQAAASFRARRAVLEVDPRDLDRLWLEYRGPDAAFRLTGEGIADDASAPETFLLTADECGDLLRALEREGVLAAERLPSVVSRNATGERELVVGNGANVKRFGASAGAGAPWFERLVAFATSLRDANDWQRWVDSRRHADRRALWLAEVAERGRTSDPTERARRLVELVLGALHAAQGAETTRGIAELERSYADPRVRDARDVPALVELIERAPFHSPENARLVALALAAARAGAGDAAARPGDGARALDGGPAIDAELAGGLVGALAANFGADAVPEIAAVLRMQPAPVTRAAVRSARSALRAGGALALGSDASPANPANEALLAELFEDPDEVVQAAAIAAVAARPCDSDSARTFAELTLARAASPSARVRSAAYGALAACPDAFTLGALLGGLSDEDAEARRAAALGLASLRDPEALPILLSMLARGPRSDLFGPARAGLVGLGRAAHEELLRVVHRRSMGEAGEAAEVAREAALILAEGGVAEAASPLIAILTDDPGDERVAWELAVLTCVDLRGRGDPAGAWWEWWDGAVHDDALAWLLAAGARLGLDVPEREALVASGGRGDRAGAEFLFDLAVSPEAHVAARAERELERRLGRELELPRAVGSLSSSEEALLGALRERVLAEGWPK